MSAKNPAPTTPAAPEAAPAAPAAAPAINIDAIKAKVIADAHPAANLFPMMSADEFNNLLVSVRQHGFDPSKPVKRCQQTKKITDGRNREAAVQVVNAEIAAWNTDPANATAQKPLLSAVYIEEATGNDAEVLQGVLQDNFTRRHLSPSQKAAVIVKAGILSSVYQKRAELGEAGKRVAGDIVALVASQNGVNTDFIYKAKAIAKTPKIGRALLDAIASGEKSIMAAYAEIKKVGEGVPDAGNEPANPDAVLDGLKKAVAAEWVPTFESRAKFGAVAKLLRDAAKLMTEIATVDGGQLLAEGNSLKEAKQGIAATAKALRNCEPHVVCPHCDGDGKHPTKGGKHVCPACAGIGFLTEPQHKTFLEHGVIEEDEVAVPAVPAPPANGKAKSKTKKAAPATSTETESVATDSESAEGSEVDAVTAPTEEPVPV